MDGQREGKGKRGGFTVGKGEGLRLGRGMYRWGRGRANVEEKGRVIVGKRELCRVGKGGGLRFEKGQGWENKVISLHNLHYTT